jgi:hypothetical protein
LESRGKLHAPALLHRQKTLFQEKEARCHQGEALRQRDESLFQLDSTLCQRRVSHFQLDSTLYQRNLALYCARAGWMMSMTAGSLMAVESARAGRHG